jgi:hypothetical protein
MDDVQRIFHLMTMGSVEVVTGGVLLVWPWLALGLILGLDRTAPETAYVARIAGGGLVAFGVACWTGRHGRDRISQNGLLVGALVYDVIAIAVLACAASLSGLNGIALWPAVAVHAALAIWCVACLSGERAVMGHAEGTASLVAKR